MLGHLTNFNRREEQEIQLALYYAVNLAHGTAGHNRLMLLAKMALLLGFYLAPNGKLERLDDADALAKALKDDDNALTGDEG